MTSAYSASKFALMGLSDSLMQEVRKHNIRVTALNPSTVVTDLAISANLINNNEDRVMHPEDFAELICSPVKIKQKGFCERCFYLVNQSIIHLFPISYSLFPIPPKNLPAIPYLCTNL
jgi:short-subunit dehydrogenase